MPTAHPAGAVRALRRALRSPAFASIEEGSYGSSVSESSSSGGEGRATTFVRRSRGGRCRGQGAGWAVEKLSEPLVLPLRLLTSGLWYWKAKGKTHTCFHLATTGRGGLTVEVAGPFAAPPPARPSFP